MASNHSYGPYQPQQMQNTLQNPTTAQPATQPTHSPCYNCGSIQHWAQYCPEPRRQVPAGLSNQKVRPPNPKPTKKGSKPVITRYAPPPGYVPPQPAAAASAAPPPPPPPATVVYGQHPPYNTQTYAQPTPPVTPQQWQQSPQTYTAPTPQWQQTTTPAFGPHQPPQPNYAGYGQPQSAYPTPTSAQQSPAQGYPPQHQYAAVHQQPQGYPPYAGTQQSPNQSPQTAYPPQVSTPRYPSNPQYPQPQAQPQPQLYSQPQAQPSTFQPYQPPPMTNYPRYPHPSTNSIPYSRPTSQSFRHNQQNNHHNGHGNNKGNRAKRFQPPPPPEVSNQRPPSPPHFFPPAPISTWKNGPADRPLAATFEETDEQKPLSIDKGKNLLGSKYFDTEGNAINQRYESGDSDPVWTSIRTDGTTRVNLDAEYQPDAETEAWIASLKKDLLKEDKNTGNSLLGSGEMAGDLPNGKKTGSGEGKKRNWEEYIVNQKNGQDPERRPSKRRHDGRNRRGNRNRHGNKPPTNRNAAQDTPAANSQTPIVTQLPVQRSVHPLPPKPPVGPSPHNSSLNTENLSTTQKSRRSASPDRAQKPDTSYRQRDYGRGKQDDVAIDKKVPENADVRRHGAAAIEAYR